MICTRGCRSSARYVMSRESCIRILFAEKSFPRLDYCLYIKTLYRGNFLKLRSAQGKGLKVKVNSLMK